MQNTEYVPEINRLLNLNEEEAAEQLLLICLDLTEQVSNEKGYGIATWYYERLAILYHKQKEYYKEVEVLNRYDNQLMAHSVKPPKL